MNSNRRVGIKLCFLRAKGSRHVPGRVQPDAPLAIPLRDGRPEPVDLRRRVSVAIVNCRRAVRVRRNQLAAKQPEHRPGSRAHPRCRFPPAHSNLGYLVFKPTSAGRLL